jgi:hypothetical protein
VKESLLGPPTIALFARDSERMGPARKGGVRGMSPRAKRESACRRSRQSGGMGNAVSLLEGVLTTDSPRGTKSRFNPGFEMRPPAR